MKVYVVTEDEHGYIEGIFTNKRRANEYMRALEAVETSYSYGVREWPVDEARKVNPILGFEVYAREGDRETDASMVIVGREADGVDVGAGGRMKGICSARASAPSEAEARKKAMALIAKKRKEIDDAKAVKPQ